MRSNNLFYLLLIHCRMFTEKIFHYETWRWIIRFLGYSVSSNRELCMNVYIPIYRRMNNDINEKTSLRLKPYVFIFSVSNGSLSKSFHFDEDTVIIWPLFSGLWIFPVCYNLLHPWPIMNLVRGSIVIVLLTVLITVHHFLSCIILFTLLAW